MKYYIILILIIIFNFSSFSQETSIKKIGENDYSELIFNNGFKVYVNQCANKIENEFANNIIIKYNDLKNIGYLNSYNVDSGFRCFALNDRFLITQLKELIQTKENLNNKICLLFSMIDKNQEFIFYILVFSKKNFNKFLKRQSRIKRKFNRQTREVDQIIEINYSKYANEYIIAKQNKALKLFELK